MPIKNLKQVTLRIKKITWQETIPIRHEVLWPNKTPEFCHVEGDELAQHFGLFIDECLVSVASIYLDNGAARLRKFATLNHYQGRGYGTALLQHILEALKADGVRLFWCDARESAIGFY